MPTVRQIRQHFKENGKVVLEARQKFYRNTLEQANRFKEWLNDQGIENREDLKKFIEIFKNELYKDTAATVENNSKYGWTLASSMAVSAYLDKNLEGKTKQELDSYFYSYYSEDDWDEYEDLKKDIKEKINPKWNELIDDCFYLFENKRYKTAIPALFTIIEGELTSTLKTHKYGGPLKDELKDQTEKEGERLKKIGWYSLLTCINDALYPTSSFSEERNEVINRHWVLHGRDNPKLWEEVDVLRLLTMLNSIQYVQRMNKEDL